MKNILGISVLLFVMACHNNKVENNSHTTIDSLATTKAINCSVSYLPSNDTNNVEFGVSNMNFKLHYFNNAIQYVNIDNNIIGDANINHYVRENKGIYFSLNPELKTIESFGVKYLNGHNGIDALIKNTEIQKLNIWKEYSNDGCQYDFSRITKGEIILYYYKDGSIVDSSIFHK